MTVVPDVLDELVRVLDAHPDMSEVQVLDGPTKSGDYKPVAMIVGFRPTEANDITVTRAAPRGYRSNDSEQYSIGFTISAVDGNNRVKAARDLARAAYEVLERILAADMKLNGVAHKLVLGPSVSWWQIPTTKGIEVNIAGEITGATP
jgi:hypothetical protein